MFFCPWLSFLCAEDVFAGSDPRPGAAPLNLLFGRDCFGEAAPVQNLEEEAESGMGPALLGALEECRARREPGPLMI